MTDPDTRQGPDDGADIAWMRSLAEENAKAPYRGGSILMTAGLVFGLTSVAHWAVQAGLTPFNAKAFGPIWIVATVVFLAIGFTIRAGLSRSEGVRTNASRINSAAWSGVGWGIFAMMSSITVIGYRVGLPGALVALGLIPSVILVFYGMAWAVSAASVRSKAMTWLAGGSLVSAPLVGALFGRPEQYLAFAICLFVLMAVPGFLLMRQAARAA